MTNTILLISEQTIKGYSLVNGNVDTQYILPAIQYAQDQGLQPLIGTRLYRTLCALVENEQIEENLPYKELLDDYITPFLINKVMADIQVPVSFKIRNQGIIQNTGDNTYVPQIKDIQYVQQYYNNKADFYANRLTDFLCANVNTYKEYVRVRNGADMPAKPGAYNTGIYLG